MNPFVRLLYALIIAAATIAFIGVGIYTFYPAPQPPTYPQNAVPLEKGIASQPSSTIHSTGDGSSSTGVDEYQQAYDKYQNDLKGYQRNVSIIASVFAAIAVAAGLYIRRRAEIIGEGLALGGIGTSIYAIITASMADDRVMRFVAVTLFLASAIVISYTLFNNKLSPKANQQRKS